MKWRVLVSIVLCLIAQHACAARADLDRCKRELCALYAVAVDGHKTLEARSTAITQARAVIQTIRGYEINFNSRAFRDITCGGITITGNGFDEVNTKLAAIVADLQRIEEGIGKVRAERYIESIRALDASHRRLAEMLGGAR